MRIILATLVLFSLAVFEAQAEADIIVESTFDTNVDGWQKLSGSDPASSVNWISTGGNPGGYLRYNEVGAGFEDFISAPNKFLGDKSLFYGGIFSFDRRTNVISNSLGRDNDVLFFGNGMTLRYNLPDPSVGSWTSHTIDLVETGWFVGNTSVAPTTLEMQSVLANLTAIHLHVDFRSGAETPAYDNIRLWTSAVPEPNSLAFTCAGLLGLGLRRRRT